MFQPGTMIMFEGALSFGVPVAWAVRELLILHRRPPRDDPPPPPVRMAPLPPALPLRVRARERVLEDA